MPDVGNLPGWVALVVAGIGAWASLRKIKVDERGVVVTELNQLVDTLREELARVNARSKERDAEMVTQLGVVRNELEHARSDCQKQITLLQLQVTEQQATIVRQSNLISQLERRRAARPDSEAE
jgi:hypothetical protein